MYYNNKGQGHLRRAGVLRDEASPVCPTPLVPDRLVWQLSEAGVTGWLAGGCVHNKYHSLLVLMNELAQEARPLMAEEGGEEEEEEEWTIPITTKGGFCLYPLSSIPCSPCLCT